MSINLILGNCMDLMKDKPDNYYDLAIVDPPYGLDDWNERGSNKKLYNKKHMNLNQIQNFENKTPQKDYFNCLFMVSKNQIIWGGNHFLDYLGKTKEIIVWDKTIRGMHFNDCEIAWCSGIKEACRIYTKTPNNLDRIHPTQKPIALYKWLLKNYAKPGDKILDTHGGSFSHAIAVHEMNEFHQMDLSLDIIEIDKDYFEAGKKRYENHIKQLTIFSK